MSENPTLTAIKAYCRTHKMSPSRFGRLAANDSALVLKLKKGRRLRERTARRIENFMKSEEEDGKDQG